MSGGPARGALASLAFGLLAVPAVAQPRVEISPFVTFGYTTSASLERTAPQVEALEIRGGFTWGAHARYLFGRHLGAEVTWAQQEGALRLTAGSRAADLFDVNVAHLHANLTYEWGGQKAKVRPFVMAGLGPAFLSAPNLPSETKFSWAIGGGVKLLLAERFGFRFQAKYKQTRLDDAGSAPFCDGLGFCSDALRQGELSTGIVLRF